MKSRKPHKRELARIPKGDAVATVRSFLKRGFESDYFDRLVESNKYARAEFKKAQLRDWNNYQRLLRKGLINPRKMPDYIVTVKRK